MIKRNNLNIYKIFYFLAAAPKIKLPERYKSTVLFEKGETISVRVPFTGFPQPTAKWLKGGEEVKPTSGTYQIETSSHYVTLKINNPGRAQSGVYKLVLENPLGSDSAEINIQVAGLSLFLFFNHEKIKKT